MFEALKFDSKFMWMNLKNISVDIPSYMEF